MSWISERFGYPDKNGRRKTAFGIILRHGMKDENWSEYREDLARYPGDPQAYCNGPISKRKLIDQRKREGWVEGPSFSSLADKETKEEKIDSYAFVKEAYKRAEATNFKLEGE